VISVVLIDHAIASTNGALGSGHAVDLAERSLNTSVATAAIVRSEREICRVHLRLDAIGEGSASSRSAISTQIPICRAKERSWLNLGTLCLEPSDIPRRAAEAGTPRPALVIEVWKRDCSALGYKHTVPQVPRWGQLQAPPLVRDPSVQCRRTGPAV
jgi:hypothetical protein